MGTFDQLKENIANWDYVSYNTVGAAVGPWVVSGGVTGGNLQLQDTGSGSKFNYFIGSVSGGVGLSTSPVDIDISSGLFQNITGAYPSVGVGGLVFASNIKALTPSDFVGPCMILSVSGGVGGLAFGYNYISLGMPWIPVIPKLDPAGKSLVSKFLTHASNHSKAIVFEVSNSVTAVSANCGVNLGGGYSSFAGADITPPSPSPIPDNSMTGGSVAAPRTAYRVHYVKHGESLSKISMQYFGTFRRWEEIYNIPENRKKIGGNPNFILPNTRILIPQQ
ncbi:MAG: hypothetical protein AB8B55_22460 [Mariniblastus sp.]